MLLHFNIHYLQARVHLPFHTKNYVHAETNQLQIKVKSYETVLYAAEGGLRFLLILLTIQVPLPKELHEEHIL